MEKNRGILQKALGRLRIYSPDESSWEQLEETMNKKVLAGKLGEIEPPEFIWDQIEQQLDLSETSGKLQEFNPPERIWNSIEKQLNQKSKSRVLHLWTRLSLAAASILLIGLIVYFSNWRKTAQITYSEEWTETQDLDQWQQDDGLVSEALAVICREKPAACESPEFKKMEQELDFLEQSKEDILKRMNPYDDDPDLAVMLTKIELERTDIITQMITLVN